MPDSIGYRIDKAAISQERMQFSVINRRPQYPPGEREAARAEIEKQLYAVFRKYANI